MTLTIKKDEFWKTRVTLGWEAKWQETHLRRGFGSCPGLDADVNCPNAADLWKFLLFSFLLRCGVTTAQLILEVEKGWNEKKEPTVRTRSLLRVWDHKDWIVGVMLTLQRWLWRTETNFFPLYKKKTWRDQSSALSSVFSNIFSQPCKNTAFLKHCTQTVSKVWRCLKDCAHVHMSIMANTCCRVQWAVLSVWQQVEGGQHQCHGDFFLTPEMSVNLYIDETPLALVGVILLILEWARSESGPWRKYSSEIFVHIIMRYHTDREDWGDLCEALQYLEGAYKKETATFYIGI